MSLPRIHSTKQAAKSSSFSRLASALDNDFPSQAPSTSPTPEDGPVRSSTFFLSRDASIQNVFRKEAPRSRSTLGFNHDKNSTPLSLPSIGTPAQPRPASQPQQQSMGGLPMDERLLHQMSMEKQARIQDSFSEIFGMLDSIKSSDKAPGRSLASAPAGAPAVENAKAQAAAQAAAAAAAAAKKKKKKKREKRLTLAQMCDVRLNGFLTDPEQMAALDEAYERHMQYFEQHKRESVDYLALNVNSVTQFYPDNRLRLLRERMSKLHLHESQVVEQAVHAREAALLAVLEDVRKQEMKRDLAQFNREEAPKRALREEMFKRFSVYIMIGSRVAMMARSMVESRELIAEFNKKDGAARMIQRNIQKYVSRRRKLRHDRAIFILTRWAPMYRKFVFKMRRRKAADFITRFLKDYTDAAFFFKTMKSFRRKIVKAQMIAKRFLAKRALRMQILMLQYDKYEPQVMQERNVVFADLLDGVGGGGGESSSKEDKKSSAAAADKKAAAGKKPAASGKKEAAAAASSSGDSGSADGGSGDNPTGLARGVSAQLLAEVLSSMKTFFDFKANIVWKVYGKVWDRYGTDVQNHAVKMKDYEEVRRKREIMNAARSVIAAGAGGDAQKAIDPDEPKAPFFRFLVSKTEMKTAIAEGLAATHKQVVEQFDLIIKQVAVPSEQVNALQTWLEGRAGQEKKSVSRVKITKGSVFQGILERMREKQKIDAEAERRLSEIMRKNMH